MFFPGLSRIIDDASASSGGGGGGGGGSDPNIALTDLSIVNGGTGTRTTTYRLGADGKAYYGQQAIFTFWEDWCTSPGVPSDYEARADVDTGSLFSGTTGAWLAMTANRDWAVRDTLNDGMAVEATITVQIRDVATSTVRATATIDLSADRS